MPEITIPNCPRCGTKLVKIKDKDYYGCPNWKPQNQGCEGTIWFLEGERKKSYPNIIISYKTESRSNPGHFYQVKIYESGDIYCGCMAGSMSKFCYHKRKAVDEIEKIIKKIKKENYHGGKSTRTS